MTIAAERTDNNVRELNVPISAPPPKGQIHEALVKIMGEIGGVAKGRRNISQNYSFRGIADIYLAAQPLLAKHGVHLTPHAVLSETVVDRETSKGGLSVHIRQRIEFRFYHQDGSFVSCVTTGEAMDTGDKASNKCMSAAAKYALIVTFAIPEEDPEVDTENSSPEVKAASNGKPAAARKPAAAKPAASAAPPPQREVKPAMEVGNLMMLSAPKGHGWPKPRAISWLKERFGVESFAGLNDKQLSDAKLLLTSWLHSEEKYRTHLEMLASEGRVLGDGEVQE